MGNIGSEYDRTRHNIGFDVCDALVIKYGGQFTQDRLAMRASIKIKGKPVIVIKPTTFMNLSGRAFFFWMNQEKVDLENTLTIVDDLALPLETLRLRPSGSHAGHNGLRDIEKALGHNKYPRLRFGIGNNFPKHLQVDFVLGKWHKDEEPVVIDKIKTSVEVIETFINAGIQNAMNQYNK